MKLNFHVFITLRTCAREAKARIFRLRILLTTKINFLCRVVVHYALNFKRGALIISPLKIMYGLTDYLFTTFSKRSQRRATCTISIETETRSVN